MGGFSNRNIHEGEYVSIPSRAVFPISRTTNTTPSHTPHRPQSPNDNARHPLDPRSVLMDRSSPPTSAPSPMPSEVLPMVHKWSHTHSILSVVAAPNRGLILCGTQDSKILIFDVGTFALKHIITCGHDSLASSVLCLTIDPEENFLFSAGSDSLVKVWDLSPFNDRASTTFDIKCELIAYSCIDIGDIFSISWSPSLSTLFIGAQNASVMWCKLDLSSRASSSTSSANRLPHLRFDRFFDSKGPGGSINRLQSEHELLRNSDGNDSDFPALIEIKNENHIKFAHNGYVYCMEFVTKKNAPEFCDLYKSLHDQFLVTCGGDGKIKLWGISKGSTDDSIHIEESFSLENDESILSMYISKSSIYVGLANSTIKAWDLTTCQLTRSFNFVSDPEKDSEILSLTIFNGCVYKATNNGGLCKFKLQKEPHDGSAPSEKLNSSGFSVDLDLASQFNDEIVDVEYNPVFAVSIFEHLGSTFLISGGLESLCLWNITNVGESSSEMSSAADSARLSAIEGTNEHLLASLKKLISYKTISKYPSLYLEDSRQCARYFSKLFLNSGADETKLLPVPNCNPIVYARFARNKPGLENTKPVRVLWYGHYDVVDAIMKKDYWDTDPFKLIAKDGCLYGRGVSDNKGPILAAMYAVAELSRKNELSTDVVFLIEGEEECGSIGFQDVVNANKGLIGEIDWVMLSNSYWIDDNVPCLNYGLRGVVHASVSVESEKPDRHSGVDGGVSREPTMDLIQTLSSLTCIETNKISIPGFYDDFRPAGEDEMQHYEKIRSYAREHDIEEADLDSLFKKWSNPSLTIHRIDVSGPKNNTVISQTAKASISLRVVPNQELSTIKESLVKFLEENFAALKTDNKISIDIFHEAEPWLGDPNNLVYKILYQKIKENWGSAVPEPLFIREGGSIPSIRFLEKAFNAPAAQIPCGQASDNAHLKNEKLRIINLFKLRSILEDTFTELGNH